MLNLNRIPARHTSFVRIAALACAATIAVGCAGRQIEPAQTVPGAAGPGDLNELLVVDCLLPGRLRQLGQRLTFLTPRRPIKAPASECAIRGGEFTRYDRANFATALKIWLPLAQQGDPEAQTYVGEIYEKGLGLQSDHTLAAEWYRKAADTGFSRAQINLGFLYESGLGVEQDLTVAMNYYRAASGFEEGELEYVSSVEAANRVANQQALVDSRAQVEELQAANAELQERQRVLEQDQQAMAELREEVKRQRSLLAAAPVPVPVPVPVPALAGSDTDGDSEALQKERERNRGRISKLATALADLEQTNQTLEGANTRQQELIEELTRGQAQTGELRQELAAVNADYNEMASELKRKQQQLESLTAQLATVRAQDGDNQAARENEAELSRQLQEEQALVEELNAKLARERTESLAASSAIETRLATAESEEQQIKQQLDSQSAEIDGLNQQLLQQQSRYDEEIAALQGQLEGSRAEQSRMSQRLAEAQLANAGLNEESARQQSAIEALEANLASRLEQLEAAESSTTESASLTESVANLQGQLDSAREEQRRLATRMMETQIAAQDQQVEAALQLASLEQQLSEREALIGKQVSEIDGLRSRVTQSRAQIVEQDIEKIGTLAAAGPIIEIVEPPVVLSRGGAPTLTATTAGSDLEVIGRIDPVGDLLSFKINGQKQDLNENGVFQHTVRPSDVANLTLVAIDAAGQRTSLQFDVLGSTLTPGGGKSGNEQPALVDASGVDFGNYHALIIGNNNYEGFHDLRSAETDAIAVEQVLRERYDFKTELLLNATRYDILSALNRKRDTLTDEDNLLIYFAGHGELSKGKGYWMPVDAEPNNTSNWISNASITDLVDSMSAKHVMVIADSCYSGSLSRSSLTRLLPGMSPDKKLKWYETVSQLKVRTVLSSGGVKPVLDTSANSPHSVFAQALLDELGSAEGVVEAYELYLKVQGRVKQEAQRLGVEQDPQYSPIQHAGHESGEFLLVSNRQRAAMLDTSAVAGQ